MHKSRPLFNCSSADLDSFLGTFIKAKDEDNFIKVLYELSIRNSKYTKKIFDKYNNDIQIFIRSFILQKENEFPEPRKFTLNSNQCFSCHKTIPEERLKTLPTHMRQIPSNRLCTICQSKKEEGHLLN